MTPTRKLDAKELREQAFQRAFEALQDRVFDKFVNQAIQKIKDDLQEHNPPDDKKDFLLPTDCYLSYDLENKTGDAPELFEWDMQEWEAVADFPYYVCNNAETHVREFHLRLIDNRIQEWVPDICVSHNRFNRGFAFIFATDVIHALSLAIGKRRNGYFNVYIVIACLASCQKCHTFEEIMAVEQEMRDLKGWDWLDRLTKDNRADRAEIEFDMMLTPDISRMRTYEVEHRLQEKYREAVRRYHCYNLKIDSDKPPQLLIRYV